MQINVTGSNKQLTLDDQLFDCPFNESLIHQVVTSYMAAGRAGTKAQKSRSEVRGGGAKPWKQKGTGRARAGTIRSPIWRKGGVTFAAKPRDYSKKVNRKMYKGALRSIVSELFRQGRVSLLESLSFATPKTKEMISYLKSNDKSGKVLVIGYDLDDNVILSSRNLFDVNLIDVQFMNLDPVSLIESDHVLMTEAALNVIQEVLQ